MTGPRYNIKLDPNLYSPKEDEKAFLKQLTGIEDEDELKKHVLNVQQKAFEVHPYPCIQGFRFLNMKISRFPFYQDVLALGRDRPGAILLDMGCCFGNDARKAAADGYPAEQIIASDLRPEYWELGHKLFKDDASSLPITFIPGDIFDDNFIAAGCSLKATLKVGETSLPPSLQSLHLTSSLIPLTGKVSTIHTSAFFHLFDEQQQLIVAQKLATLLSPEAGSVIFGSHTASATEKGVREEDFHGVLWKRFRHSLGSFKEMWEKEIFQNGEVVCETYNPMLRPGGERCLFMWSVQRI